MNSAMLFIEIATFIMWWFLPIYPLLRGPMSFGMGLFVIHAVFYFFLSGSAIRHHVWCDGRRECGE
jgi:hypothetical protein